MVGIYKITSPSGKVYIGQSVHLEVRREQYARHHCKDQRRLHYSITKYGFLDHIFEVVEECSVDQLNTRERYWQDFYDVMGKKGLNCMLQSTSDLRRVISDQAREVYSKTRRELNAGNKGKPHSEEAKASMRKAALLREYKGPKGPKSEEHKRKLSDALKKFNEK